MFSSREKNTALLLWISLLTLFVLVTSALIIYQRHNVSFLPLILVLCGVILASALFMSLLGRKKRIVLEAAHYAELMELQRELDKTARRYKSLLEGAGNAIFVFDAESGRLHEVNRRGTELLGYPREEMVTLRGKDLVLEEEQDRFISLVLQVKRRGRGRADGITFRRKDGGCFLGEVEARLIPLGDEQVVHAIVRDVTDRHQAESLIRQRNRELSILNSIIARANENTHLQTVLDIILLETLEVFGADGGGIHLVNQESSRLRAAATYNFSERLIGTLDEGDLLAGILGRIIETHDALRVKVLGSEACHFAATIAERGWQSFAGVPLLAKSRVIGVMYILCREEREFTDEELQLFLSIGNQMGIVIEHARFFNELSWKSEELMRSFRLLERSSHQLTVSQNRLRENLALVERANLELERIDRMKSHFLGMVSHEFKTPLTSILSGTEFLMSASDTGLSDDARLVLTMIHRGGCRLNEIVNDILKLARLEASTHSVAKTSLQLDEIFVYVTDQLTPLFRERNLLVRIDSLQDLPHFSGDREYLEDVFTELLENAVKFTPDGGTIDISGRVVDSASLAEKAETLSRFNSSFYGQMGNRCYLELMVRDSGIGINPEEQQKIFDKFYEVGDICHHSSGKYKFQGKGAGLGLAIVKGMVEAHGGMVWVESSGLQEVDAGSVFCVLLPLEQCPTQPAFPFMLETPTPGSHRHAADDELSS